MSDEEDSGFAGIVSQLKEIKDENEKEWDENIIKRTISSLLSIEKKALYGALRGKAKLMDDIILNEMKNHKEKSGAAKED